MFELFHESIKPITNANLFDEEMNENMCKYFILFHETNTGKWFFGCHVQINSFSIYLSNFTNDLFKV